MQAIIKRSMIYGGTVIPRKPQDGFGSTAESSATMSLIRTTERTEIRSGNTLVGYMEDGELFGIDRQGYAAEIGRPDDDREAVRMLKEWWNNVR